MLACVVQLCELFVLCSICSRKRARSRSLSIGHNLKCLLRWLSAYTCAIYSVATASLRSQTSRPLLSPTENWVALWWCYAYGRTANAHHKTRVRYRRVCMRFRGQFVKTFSECLKDFNATTCNSKFLTI